MLVQATFASGGRKYTYDAPEGTEIGDELSASPDGLGARLTVVEVRSDYEGEVAQLYDRADAEDEDTSDDADGEA